MSLRCAIIHFSTKAALELLKICHTILTINRYLFSLLEKSYWLLDPRLWQSHFQAHLNFSTKLAIGNFKIPFPYNATVLSQCGTPTYFLAALFMILSNVSTTEIATSEFTSKATCMAKVKTASTTILIYQAIMYYKWYW